MSNGAEAGSAAEREIVISRSIEGPRRLVFLAYTSAAHLAQWWGPYGFSITTHSFEFGVGGIWEFSMHGPDGTDYPNWIEWQEIVPEERIVLLHGSHAGDPEAFQSTISFVEQGRATLVTMRAEFRTKARRDEVVERFGAIEGGRQTLARLAAFIARAPAWGAPA